MMNPQFIEMIKSLPADKFGSLAETLLLSPPEVSVRYNPAKERDIPGDGDAVPWCAATGRYLSRRPAFTLDPAMHQGRYYVQEASSMFVSHVASHIFGPIARPVAVLDACAAPGGKSTAMAAVLPAGSLVVANEYVPSRAAVLCENIIKWGYEGMVVTTGDTARLSRLRDTFDAVLIDAPCSGEGMMRKDTKAVEQWTPSLVHECALRQREIIANLLGTVKPGGYLIYSTCTFNTTENEQMVRHIMEEYGAEPVSIPVDPSWRISGGVDTAMPCYRFIPGTTRGEGLFMAVMRKPDTTDTTSTSVHTAKPVRHAKAKVPETVKEWIMANEAAMAFSTATHDGAVNAFPHQWLPLLQRVEDCAKVIHAGVTVAEPAGKELAPSHQLAMSCLLNKAAFPSADVDVETARDYLRRQAIPLPPGMPRGYVLVTYQGVPLGFVKNLGSRANNLYPRNWRIINL